MAGRKRMYEAINTAGGDRIGSIRPTYIKSISEELLRGYREIFSSDYERNKELVSEYTNIESKNIRNRVAGYITHKIDIGNRSR